MFKPRMAVWISFVSLFSLLFCAPSFAAQVLYTVDPNHTYVEWRINHLGFSHPSGKWYVNGTVMFDQEKLENSRAEITIPVAAMVTGLPELDKHLRSKEFFSTEQFPQATFISNKVTVKNNKISELGGILTLRGIAKPVSLTVKENKIGLNPITEQQTIGFSGEAKIKRSDFGMTAFLPALGDEVSLIIELEASPPKKLAE